MLYLELSPLSAPLQDPHCSGPYISIMAPLNKAFLK